MTETKIDILQTAFEDMAVLAGQIDRQIALDLPGESFFTAKWEMIQQLLTVGLRDWTEKGAGNCMSMIVEEMPSIIRYAVKHAEADASADADAVLPLLEEFSNKALTALGDDVYKDVAMEWRR